MGLRETVWPARGFEREIVMIVGIVVTSDGR
jgi:hypothetical protein